MRSVKEINELFLMTLIFAFGGAYLYALIGHTRNDQFVSLLYNQVILILPTVGYVYIKKISVKEMFRFNRISWNSVILLIAFAFLIMPLVQLVNLISLLFTKNIIASTMNTIIRKRPLFISVLVIGLVPAILEESVYRGTFLSTYSQVSRKKAILLSGLLFGLLHLNFNQFSYAFIMGVILCVLVEGTDSIFASMVVHFIINASNVVMVYIEPYMKNIVSKSSGQMSALDSQPSRAQLLKYMPYYAVRAVIFSIAAYFVLKQILRIEGHFEKISDILKDNKEDLMEPLQRQSIWSMPLIVSIFICIAYMVLVQIKI